MALSFLGIPIPAVFILLVELCERLTFYTVKGSVKIFLQQYMSYDQADSSSLNAVFSTTCYLTCLLGGAVADRYLGRYLTILTFAALYVVGTFMTAISTYPTVLNHPLFFIGLFVGIAFGTGGIKPNVCNFGADQMAGGKEAAEAQKKYFSYFYWMINIGGSVGLGFMTQLATTPTNFGIAESKGFFLAYLIAAIVMTVALALFGAGTCTYIEKYKKSTTPIFRPIWRCMVYSAKQSFRGKVCLLGWLLLIPFFVLAYIQAFAQGDEARAIASYGSLGVCAVAVGCLTWCHCDNRFLETDPQTEDLHGHGANGLTTEEIRMTFQSLPILLVANLSFFMAYQMMSGAFYSEACQMNLRIGKTGQISGTFFNLGDGLAVILLIPIFESFIYPWMSRRQGSPVTRKQKLLGALAWGACGMIVAAILEVHRRNAPISFHPAGWEPGSTNQTAFWPSFDFEGKHTPPATIAKYMSFDGQCTFPDGTDYCSNCAPQLQWCPDSDEPWADTCDQPISVGEYMSDSSSFWMFLPYSMIGAGEVMISPVLLYFAYAMAPHKTRSVVQAISMVFQGALPPALSSVFTTVLHNFQPNNLNDVGAVGIEILYYVSLAIILMGGAAYLMVEKACNLVEPEDDDATDLRHLTGSFHG